MKNKSSKKNKTDLPYQVQRFENAATILAQIATWASPSDKILSSFFRDNRQLGQNDRAFIAESIYFVLRHKSSLAYVLKGCLAEINRLRDVPRDWLIAAYACKITEGCSDMSLEAWRSEVRNKVLPFLPELDLIKSLQNISWPPQRDQSESDTLDLPKWLVDSFSTLDLINKDASALLDLAAALNKPAPLDLRVNTLKISLDDCMDQLEKSGINVTMGNFSPYALRVLGNPLLYRHPLFLNGGFEVQDEGSQLICQLLTPKRGEAIFDFCAGAGGKTLMLGQLMRNSGRLYAADISEKRLGLLKPRLARSGLSNVHLFPLDSEVDKRLKRYKGKIDRVLVDAPCSGSGTLRRNPDLKWRRNPQDIVELATKQKRILESAANLVRSGGRLVYATCSLLQEENEAVINDFLAKHDDFQLINAENILLPYLKKNLNLPNDFLILYPHIHGSDGFFAAVLERN